VTIKLYDIEAQKDYSKSWEKYEQQEQKAMQVGSGVSWPQYPKPPEPMIDSREKPAPLHPMPSIAPMGPLSAVDPRPQGLIDFDGNSQSVVKGFESRWTSCEDAPATPFTLKK
jgi:hypothetical protein